MPKQRITKEMVVDAAFGIARSSGMEQVLVKNIADRIGCSVQPVYSYCRNAEGLRRDVTERAKQCILEYIKAHVDQNDLFRSIWNAYIQLAREEPQLFKISIMHQREGISSLDEFYDAEAGTQAAEFIADQLQVSVPQARQLHLHMMVYTIGLGTIFSVTTPGIAPEEIFAQQEMAYEVFMKQMSGHDY